MTKDITDKASQDENIKAQAPARISGRRLWLFRVITVIILPILLLVLLEVVLRVAGYGFEPSAFIKMQLNGRTVYSTNPKFGWRFFPPEIARFLPPFVVPADKPDNTYRIFILGESAAWGDPDPSYCFGRHLSVLLRQRYPSVNFEVYTAAMVAINSHAIVRIADDCARLKPDLFIVYAGNNEVVGPFGAGTVFSPLSKNLFLIKFNIAIKATKVGQLMSRLVYYASRDYTRPEMWGGMEMFLGNQIRHDDDKMQYVYRHFRRNLEDISRSAQKAGAKIIFSTVAVNLKDCPPFASMHRAGLNEQQKKSFDDLYHAGIELEQAGNFNGAYEKYLAASEIDDTYAELQFRLGRCQWNLGQFDKAKERYVRAMELDTLRFRADTKINQIIREIGVNREKQGVYFVDAADGFALKSPHNCPGFELFFDHVHPVFSGNFLLAKTIYGQVEHILPDKIKAQKGADSAYAGEEICVKQLAYTIYDRLRLTKINLDIISNKRPFTNQAYHKEATDFWRQKYEQLNNSINSATFDKAMEQYEQAITLRNTDRYLRLNYFKLMYRDKKYIYPSVEQCRLIVERTPYDFETLTALANLEAEAGNIDSALQDADKAIKYMPMDPQANLVAGTLYVKTEQYKKAQDSMSRLIRLNPYYVPGYIDLAWLLGQQGKIRHAERVYRKGIAAVPNSAALHLYLSILLRQTGRPEEAEKERQKAISLDPNIVSSPDYIRFNETKYKP